jgi:hypothetical protein
VDLRTQYSYQMMDPYFVGLIFSVYNSDPVTMVDTRDIIAFQAVADTAVRPSYTLSLNYNNFLNLVSKIFILLKLLSFKHFLFCHKIF